MISRTIVTRDECVRQLALRVAERASAEMASAAASSDEKLKAYHYGLGIRWTKHLIKAASAHVMSGLVRRGLANPATNQMARGLRPALHEAWYAVGGQVDADSSSWRTVVVGKGLIDEVFRHGWGGTVSHLQDLLILNRPDMSASRWGFMGIVLQNGEHRQLTSKLCLQLQRRVRWPHI